MTPDSWYMEANRILDRERNRGGDGIALRMDRSSAPNPAEHEGFDSPPPPPEQLTLWHEHTVECFDC